MKTCPKCNSPVEESAKFCINCGTKLEGVIDNSICPKCGEYLPNEAVFCPNCGTPASYNYTRDTFVINYGGVDFEFVKIHNVSFMSPFNDYVKTQVSDFYILRDPISYSQWWAIMGDEDPSYTPKEIKGDINKYGDRDVIAYDLIYRFGNDISDNEIDLEIANLTKDPTALKKRVALLREIYASSNIDIAKGYMVVTGITFEQCQEFCQRLNDLNLINFEDMLGNEVFSIPHYDELMFAHQTGVLDKARPVTGEWTDTEVRSTTDTNVGLSQYFDDEVIAFDFIQRFGEQMSDDEIDHEIEILKQDNYSYRNRVNLLREYYKEEAIHNIFSHTDDPKVLVYLGNDMAPQSTPKDTSDGLLGFRVVIGPVFVPSRQL